MKRNRVFALSSLVAILFVHGALATQAGPVPIHKVHAARDELNAELKTCAPDQRQACQTYVSVLTQYINDPKSLNSIQMDLVRRLASLASVDGRKETAGNRESILKMFAASTGLSNKSSSKSSGKSSVKNKPKFVRVLHFEAFSVGTEARVNVKVDDQKPRTVFEIRSSAGGLSPIRRAEVIAERLNKKQKDNPSWWVQLKVGSHKGMDIVRDASKDPKDFVVVTADPDWADSCQQSTTKLAGMIIDDLTDNFGKGRMATRVESSDADDVNRLKSIRLRREAEEAEGKNVQRAIELYIEAVEMDPAYILPRMKLAAAYVKCGKIDLAKKTLTDALDAPLITPELKAKVQEQLDRL